MSIGIYKITNPKGKIYIGQSVNLKRRKYDYENQKNCNGQILLFRSLKKYGWDGHKFEIIEECSLNLLNERERYWQDFYDVLNPKKGLNCRLTTSLTKSGKLSQKTKNKISESNKDKLKHTKENKLRISQRSKLLKNMLGKTHTLETKNKISQSKTGKTLSSETRDKMSKSASGKIKTQEHKNNISLNHPTKKSVLQINLNGDIINEFISINEASRQTGYRVSDISACCNGKQKTAFGFIWRFK
jgi:group I intron endonuclease